MVFPGDTGVPSTLSPASYRNFAPRAGLAYSPDAKTSLRASYGIFYTAFEGLSAGIMSANPPYGYDYNSIAPPLFNAPFITASSGQDVGQRFPEPIPSAGASAAHPNTSLDWSQYLPITGVPSFYPRNTTPYSESYTVAVEREVARDTVLTASYTGTQAHHLLVLISANPRQSGAVPRPQPTARRDARHDDVRTVRRKWHVHHAVGPDHPGHARAVQFTIRRRHLPEDDRQLSV
ncbi:MAG: hypothetical protein WDO73_17280 [Ignavibacteriota bacterium]